MTETMLIDSRTGEMVVADDAWERHQRIVSLRNQVEISFLQLGEELYWFEELKQYKDLKFPTFEAYLADPEVDIGRSTAFRAKAVYRHFVMSLKSPPGGLLEAGTKKLEMLIPYTDAVNVGEWVSKAAALSRSDLKLEIEEAFKSQDSPPLPEGKYRVIYADPPWQYDNSGFDQSAAAHYRTMPTDEICELPVPALVGDECVLFLWVTNTFLQDGLDVLKAWGFDYKTNLVWVKDRGPGIGWFVRTTHELLLIGTKGQGVHPKEKPNSVIVAEVSRHSKKPDLVYEMIERMYEGPYIELFARQQHSDQWDVWGNEVEPGQEGA